MKDVNEILETKLFLLLQDSISVRVYRSNKNPDTSLPGYLIIGTINNTDNSGMTNANTKTSFTLSIFTRDTTANAGTLLNTVANEVYQLIYPQPNSVLDLEPDLQCAGIELSNDYKQTLITNDAVFNNRHITFSCNIFHKN